MKAKAKALFTRYLIDAMGQMALGLFASLIIGLILSQLAQIPLLGFLQPYADMVKASSPVVGSAIGVAIAHGLKARPLVIFSSAVSGAIGYQLGGPVGAYLSSVVGAEAARLVSGKTAVDIVLTPLVTIIAGGLVGSFAGPGIAGFMAALGSFVNRATELNPFLMGMVVSTVMGLALTAPISSAAISISLGLSGLAAGAACAGCAAQMVGFAVASYQDNGPGGLISQGLGTSMLQFGNIMRKPVIWLAPTLTSAVMGPLSTLVFQMHNNAVGGGMGTSGLVGPLAAYASMQGANQPLGTLLSILALYFVLPAVVCLLLSALFRRMNWIKAGDMKLNLR